MIYALLAAVALFASHRAANRSPRRARPVGFAAPRVALANATRCEPCTGPTSLQVAVADAIAAAQTDGAFELAHLPEVG